MRSTGKRAIRAGGGREVGGKGKEGAGLVVESLEGVRVEQWVVEERDEQERPLSSSLPLSTSWSTL